MGTRVDFWVGRDSPDGWLGSAAFDGYPEGITPTLGEKVPMWPGGPLRSKRGKWPEGAHLLDAKTEDEFRARVEQFFKHREDVTRPERGWPWPWEDSCTTDYAYVFENGSVGIYCFGHPVPRVPSDDEDNDERTPKAQFPNMETRKNVTFGPRSGLIVMGG